MLENMRLRGEKRRVEQAFPSFPQQSPQLWKGGSTPYPMRFSACGFRGGRIFCTVRPRRSPRERFALLSSLYWPVAGEDPPSTSLLFSPRETHLPAERSTPEAPARIPRADVDPRRSRDPQAPPRQGAQASLGLSRVETPPPPLPLTRLRRRLPARALDGHALPRSLRVPAGGR